ncbi:hypothetical protein DTO045G8_6602 [Paecilomyces variotii]|nr:hypothetical protein DTO045G8_6602 [Paecilomyces variotii]
MQAAFNASPSATTSKTPHKLIYSITLGSATNLHSRTREIQDFTTRLKARDAIRLAAIDAKRAYDKYHKAIYFVLGDKVLLRLHRGYKMPSTAILRQKLSAQYAGPLTVKRRIRRLAYQLDIPAHWRCHDIFSVAHLEPYYANDPFKHPIPTNDVPPVRVDADDDSIGHYKINTLLDRRIRKVRGKDIIKYLVRWIGYRPQHNIWYRLEDLSEASELVRECDKRLGPIALRKRRGKRATVSRN